ncbi:MAG: cation:proton antiporter [Bacteroidales bacterium]|jgi:Kef-type K+ transport system membrane component KefB|nr:cation:proton antiporter [Bacteroidales bacterium]
MIEYFDKILESLHLPFSDPVLVFAIVLFIILLAPLVFKKIKVPGIIGLILSGIIIGPYGLNLIENNSAINLFSTIGLLYIMFIAGLELDMNQFKANRNRSIVFGFFTFTIPLLIGYPVCHYILGYSITSSLLIASMFSTHTLIAYPIVSRLGIAKNQAVAITVGGTILTDTAVLMILAVIIGYDQGNLSNEFWIKLGISLTVFSIIMFALIPRISKWFFRNLESEKHSHYIYVLFVVFLAAFLAEISGLEPIIGAFVAGLVLNRMIPHSSVLMNRIEFIGNSLFIPFFLISVGMMVDLRVVFSGFDTLIVAIILTVVAIVGKWIAAFFTQQVFRYSRTQRKLIFGLSSSHAAATLAIIIVGHNVGIIDDNVLNGTIILILFTCIISSFVTERAATNIILEEENEDLEKRKVVFTKNEHILIPVAKIESLERLLIFSDLVINRTLKHEISLLSIVPFDKNSEINVVKAKKALNPVTVQASASEVKTNAIVTVDHNIAGAISRISKEIWADIIIMGWPQPTAPIDKFVGTTMSSIIENTDITIFTCYFNKALETHDNIVLVSLPLSETEIGFLLWFQKIAALAQELSKPIIYYCDKKTEEAVRRVIVSKKLDILVKFERNENWDNFNEISENVDSDDLVIVVSTRPNNISYRGVLENLPNKMVKSFFYNSRIIIYPQQEILHHTIEVYDDISSAPLNRSIETYDKIRRWISYRINNIKRNK